jgi:hypothetical protein
MAMSHPTDDHAHGPTGPARPQPPADRDDGVLRISCDDCVARASPACEDCVVTFLCEREPGDAVVIDVVEARALRLLERGGLAPALRHRRRTG